MHQLNYFLRLTYLNNQRRDSVRLEAGSITNAQEIAQIYQTAFPESVRFFFGSKKPARLNSLLTNSFGLVLLWGGQVLLARNWEHQVVGYCIYSKKPNPIWRNLSWQMLGSTLRMGGSVLISIRPSEVIRLAFNKLIMAVQAKRYWSPPPEKGRIVSIAVSPTVQGSGIGTQLLTAALQKLDKHSVFLNVRTKNQAGRRMYEGANFQYYGQTKDLLGEWLMMVRLSETTNPSHLDFP